MPQHLEHIYPPETAGRAMADRGRIPVVPLKTSIVGARTLIESKAREFDSINYIYVVTQDGLLRGVVSIKELLLHGASTGHVDDIMQKEIISVRPHTHQERAGLLALRHSLKAVPVVDKEGLFLGVVLPDSILKIIDKEAVEDYLRMGGIYYKGNYDDLLKFPVLKSVKHRLPWLIVGLFGGLVVAGIVSGFEEILSQHLILAAFMPLIVYMADAAGTQMTTFVIRDLAINPNFSFTKYLLKQIAVMSPIAFVTGTLLAFISYFLHKSATISLVLGAALIIVMLSSVISGLIIPYILSRFKFDPANASGPVATIIQDTMSISIYFLIAFWLL